MIEFFAAIAGFAIALALGIFLCVIGWLVFGFIKFTILQRIDAEQRAKLEERRQMRRDLERLYSRRNG